MQKTRSTEALTTVRFEGAEDEYPNEVELLNAAVKWLVKRENYDVRTIQFGSADSGGTYLEMIVWIE